MRTETSPVESERARWPRVGGLPHRELRSLLDRDYGGFTEATEPSELVLPATASVPFIVKIRDSARRPPQFLTGAHGSYFPLDGACSPSYLEVWLAPLGAYTLLGVPMEQLRGEIVELGDVFGAAGTRLGEMVRDAPTWGERFALVDHFLLRRLETGPQPSPEVAWAWRRLVDTGGAVPIRRIAGEVGWSHKHLIARFKHQVGLPPKTAARLVRFERVRRRLDRRSEMSWADIAAESGYADQAHLVREFRGFTGTTPTGFVTHGRAA